MAHEYAGKAQNNSLSQYFLFGPKLRELVITEVPLTEREPSIQPLLVFFHEPMIVIFF